MKPEIIRPRRSLTLGHVLVLLVALWCTSAAYRVIVGLVARDAAEPAHPRGPACTSTIYYEPYSPSPIRWDEAGRRWCTW